MTIKGNLVPAFESHDALLQHDGDTCDGLYVDAIERAVVQPTIIVLDLLDPMGKEWAILTEAVTQTLADALCQMAEEDDESSTLTFDMSSTDALQMFANMPDDELAPLKTETTSGKYRLAIIAAGAIAFHERDIPAQPVGNVIVDIETPIQRFLDIANKIMSESDLTAEDILQRFLAFYRDLRIEGAALDDDGDMLLLQWGTSTPLATNEPLDMRNLSDEDIKFEQRELKYLDFTRQVFASNDGNDEDFDDAAVQLSMTLFFAPATGNERSSNQWIDHPDKLDSGLKEFRAIPFVLEHLRATPQRLTATVSHCG